MQLHSVSRLENSTSIENDVTIDQWYNILSGLPGQLPEDRDLDDGSASRIDLMRRIRPSSLSDQDRPEKSWIPIPEPVLQHYREIGRPTPLKRAQALEQHLGTNARIYLKREDVLPTHSFKLNSAIAQAYYAKSEGYTTLISETGAGQWGLALAYAARLFGLKVKIFWVRVSEEQKKYRSDYAQLLGAEIIQSPSMKTMTGRKTLEQDPNCPGSLGIAIGEAVEYTSQNKDCCYLSGSNLPHVLMHQTVIGLETKAQLANLGVKPDHLIACCGGGSNLGGFIGPFLPEKEKDPEQLQLHAAESTAAPRLTTGQYIYDHSDPLGLTPLTLSYTLGRDYVPPAVHTGGLRQHNGSPVIGLMQQHGLLQAQAYDSKEAIETGRLFCQLYGTLPAPETCHALAAVSKLAKDSDISERRDTLVACYSGNGLLDINAYSSSNSTITIS